MTTTNNNNGVPQPDNGDGEMIDTTDYIIESEEAHEKNMDEWRKKFRVLEFAAWTAEGHHYKIISVDDIKRHRLCELHDCHGQKSECDMEETDEDGNRTCDCDIEMDSVTYWDGNNWVSVILSDELNLEDQEIFYADQKIEREILDDYHYAEYVDGEWIETGVGIKEMEGNKYKFLDSQFQGFWGICDVESKN